MDISASAVKELREKTGVGMMDCKKALVETGGDLEKAVAYLREKGLSVATKKSDRAADQGRFFSSIRQGRGVLLDVGCETDFVSGNADFKALGDAIATAAANDASVQSLEDLEKTQIDGKSLKEVVSSAVLKLGENISVREMIVFDQAGMLFSYIHQTGKIGVLLEFSGSLAEELGKDIAMHIAASAPLCLSQEEVPVSELDREKEIIRNQAINEGRPEKLLEKIVEGRIAKFFKENCLLEQTFVKDPEKTIKSLLPEGSKIVRFKRLAYSA